MAPKRMKPLSSPLSSPLSPQWKFMATRTEVSRAMIERDEEVDVILTAMIAQENPLLVGPPGTAKSMLCDAVIAWMDGGRKFSQLMTKTTYPEEIFGPFSITKMKQDLFVRVTTNRLPEAHVAFLDEIFKAGSSILNTMLKILNERTFENGDGTFRICPLLVLIAASNEWPAEQEELGALFDRFLFRKTVKVVSSDPTSQHRLLYDDVTPVLSTKITPDEISQANQEAKALPMSEQAVDVLTNILNKLVEEGISPGDRRRRKSVMAAKAFAYLNGAGEVQPEHLAILSHVLWNEPGEQQKKAGEIVQRMSNPIGHRINELLLQGENVIRENKPADAYPKLESIRDQLKALNNHPKKDKAVMAITDHIARIFKSVVEGR